MNTAFFLEQIQETVETALYTASIRDAVPVSLVLVADSGTAKSKLLLRFQDCPGIHITDSFSSQGLFDLTQADVKGELRFIVTPDLNPTIARKNSTAQSTVANLLSLTADGTCRVDDGRREKVAKHKPVGFLTACTPHMYDSQAKRWFALGLRRRIIPIFYTYGQNTEHALMDRVMEGKITGANFLISKFIFPTTALPNIPEWAISAIMALSTVMAINMGKLWIKEKEIRKWHVAKVVPISPLVTLQTMARAHALRDKRAEVSQHDLDFISNFVAFTDPMKPVQL